MTELWLTGQISQELSRLILVGPTHQGRRSGGGEGARGGQAPSRPFFARVRNHALFVVVLRLCGTLFVCAHFLLNDRDDLLIGEESAKLFNFHSYAICNFSQHTSGMFR